MHHQEMSQMRYSHGKGVGGGDVKVLVTADGENLDANVDTKFARAPYFLVVDTENLSFEAIKNESANEFGGAGVKAAQSVIDKEVEAIITGNIGPNAYQVLRRAGIKMFRAGGKKVREVIEDFKNNKLEEIVSPGPRGMFK